MAKAGKQNLCSVVARERIYPSGVFKNTLVLLTKVATFAHENPERLGFQQKYIDVDADCFSPLGYVEHQLNCHYLDVTPRRDLMCRWVHGLAMHAIGEAAQVVTDYRPLVIPFLIEPSLGSGIGYLTRSSITPGELYAVVVQASAMLRASGDDIVFSRYYPQPFPAYYEPVEWPSDVMLVDVDADR